MRYAKISFVYVKFQTLSRKSMPSLPGPGTDFKFPKKQNQDVQKNMRMRIHVTKVRNANTKVAATTVLNLIIHARR